MSGSIASSTISWATKNFVELQKKHRVPAKIAAMLETMEMMSRMPRRNFYGLTGVNLMLNAMDGYTQIL